VQRKTKYGKNMKVVVVDEWSL